MKQVREGRFELTGGDLSLDLANTREGRPTPRPVEHLGDYPALLDWAVEAKALDPGAAELLAALARHHPRRARAALGRALEVREALFHAFLTVAGGAPVPREALATLNRALPAVLGRLVLEPAELRWAWSDPTHLDRPWWPALRAGALLLASGERHRVRACQAPDCDWLFLDHSRNGTRRWCDMAVCGNREKARRFQRRRRQARP